MWLAYAKIPIPCFSLYRAALKILVAGLCEDTHPPHLSLSGSPKDPCVAGLFEFIHTPPASPHIGKP